MNAVPPTVASRESSQPIERLLDEVTPLILTFNEAPNIARTLAKLTWAREILVVDSFSSDETVQLAQRFPQVRVVQRRFESFADQCNFGLDQLCSTWVLSLDADYVLSDALVEELVGLESSVGVVGYRAQICYCVFGKPLNASLYPPRVALHRREGARYENDGHAHRVRIAGRVEALAGAIFHDDRKALSTFIQSQDRYACLEAAKLLSSGPEQLRIQDRIRKQIVIAPVLVFFYTLLWKGLILDGWRGWYYVLQRTLAETVLSLYLIEGKWRGR